MNAVKAYILARLTESSTWRGIIVFMTISIGYALDPTQLNAWVAAAVAISAAMNITIADKPEDPIPPTKEPAP